MPLDDPAAFTHLDQLFRREIGRGQKGAVAGAIASLGLIARSNAPQIVGAMIIGPLAGIVYEQFVSRFHVKFKAGYEMLVSNLLVGLTGSVICIIGIVLLNQF